MGQFKPMVKMYTTEPSVELKLKKGGHVASKAAHKGAHGHKAMHHMADGGVPGSLGAVRGGMAPTVAPAKPSLMARRRAMMALPAAAAPAAPVGPASRLMKKGGKAKHMAEGGESKAEHAAEMKKFSKLEGELKSHEGKPASKAHKGLKKGGAAKKRHYAEGGEIDAAQTKTTLKGSVKPFSKTVVHEATHDSKRGPTGEVKEGVPAGYKRGGKAHHKAGGKCYAVGGKIESKSTVGDYDNTQVHEGKHDPAHGTGGVEMANAGGFKRGGKAHKHGGKVHHYALGGGVEGNVTSAKPGVSHTRTGEVVEGKPGGYKRGGHAKKAYATGGAVNNSGRPVAMPKKAPSAPVRISRLSGTFAQGGDVSSDVDADLLASQKAYRDHYAREAAENRADREAMNPLNWAKALADKVKKLGSVTTKQTEVSRTVSPAQKKRGGRIKK